MKRTVTLKTAKDQSCEGTIGNPIIELVNAPKHGATLQRGALEGLLDIARANKTKRLLIIFDR